jgi:glucuronokinase
MPGPTRGTGKRTSEPARRSEEGIAYARAGLLGNPSDVYGGKVIALSVTDFRARVIVEPSASFALLPGESDMLTFPTAKEASRAFDSLGCEDGLRLLRAALREFTAHWSGFQQLADDDPLLRFTMRHQSDIPRQVGLAGSSAIIIAAVRALMSWFDVQIEPAVLAELALAAEVEDLGITAGPMDRVIQAYEGVMLMDLREPRTPASYRRLSPEILPPLFLAWDPRGGKCSGIAHGDLKARWEQGDPEVHGIMSQFRDLVDEGVALLEASQPHTGAFRDLVSRNFEMRSRIFHISERDKEMVAIARRHGAAAKLSGSGGAVIGVPAAETDLGKISGAYRAAGFEMIRPRPIEES